MKTILRILAVCFLCSSLNAVQAQRQEIKGSEVTQVRLLGKTKPLRDKVHRSLPSIKSKKQERKQHFEVKNFLENVPMKSNNPDALPSGVDPVRQLNNPNVLLTPVEAINNFDGIDDTETGWRPPDTNGDVSPDHYVQVVNGGGSIFKIFDKDGNLLIGPINMNFLWEDFNLTGLGDAVILWDQGAERWLFTEFGQQGDDVMFVAVSETSDPMGSFYAYEFQTPFFPDYPKYGVWNNGYYVTTNEGGDASIPVYVLDRAAMINGAPTAAVQRVGIPKFLDLNSYTFQVAAPADWDGALNPPPANSPHYVLRMYDDAWDGGQDKLEVWEIIVDWDDENNTTVNGPIELFTEPFDSYVCDGSPLFNCLDMPGGSNVASMFHVIMHRVQYRNFGSYEAMVLNHVVDVNGNELAGVRWYELRKPSGGQWEIYQQGTISPDDNHRWMASIAMDVTGNIGIGYSLSGPDHTFDLAFTGRYVDDPLGEMTIEENVFIEGQSWYGENRWGDYSMMAVDEADSRTFWFTSEYMKTNGNWGTRIVSFQLDRDTIDVGPIKILTPQNSAYLTATETVEVEVKNYGLYPQADFDVGLMIDDVFIDSKTITDTLQPDSVTNLIFDTPVDLSVIGDYEFKIFTNLFGDENILNDTFRQVISQLTRFDLAITSFVNLENTICDTTTQAGIVLTNIGAETITTATIDWSLNAGPVQVINWTGSLISGASDTVYMTLEPLNDGVNEISSNSSLPNGITDEDMSNDLLSRDFNVVAAGGFIQLTLLTDSYPNETTWLLEDDNGNVVYEGGPYLDLETEYIEQWCLGDGCYTFTIFDSWGDGIQSAGVQGNYIITDENGIVLASLIEANFGTEESNDFCTPFECMLEGSATTFVESTEGAGDGSINVEVNNGAAPFQYSIDGGITFQNTSLFQNLNGGVYDIVIMDFNGCSTEFQATVESCAIQVSVEVTNAHEGESDGGIVINVENGSPPIKYSINNGITFHNDNVFENLGGGTYTIVVVDSLGCEFVLDVVVDNLVDVQDFVYGNSIEILPNPTDGIFKVNVTGISDVQTMNVQMIDVSGKVIQRKRLVKYGEVLTGYLSLRNFPAGVYFVIFDHPEIQRMSKIVRM